MFSDKLDSAHKVCEKLHFGRYGLRVEYAVHGKPDQARNKHRREYQNEITNNAQNIKDETTLQKVGYQLEIIEFFAFFYH